MTNSLLKFAFLLITFISFNAQASALNTADITQLFSGKTAGCVKSKDQSICLTYMSTDGKVKRLTHSDGKTRLGTWEAVKDKLCIQWTGKSKAICFDVVKKNDNEYLLNKKGKTKSVITGFTDGDTIK